MQVRLNNLFALCETITRVCGHIGKLICFLELQYSSMQSGTRVFNYVWKTDCSLELQYSSMQSGTRVFNHVWKTDCSLDGLYSSIASYTAVKTCKKTFEQFFNSPILEYAYPYSSMPLSNCFPLILKNFKHVLHLLLIIKTHWELTV